MPSKRGGGGGGKRRGGGPFKEIIMSGIMLVIIAAGLLMIIRSNDINDVGDAIDYGRVMGTNFAECASTLIGTNSQDCPWPGDPGEGTAPGISPPGENFQPPQIGDGAEAPGGIDPEDREFFGDTGRGGDMVSGTSIYGGNFGNDYSIDYPAVLEGIEINDDPEDTDYDRTSYRHWTGSPCNTRAEVLIEQGENVETGDRCRIESGQWLDPFTDEVTEDSSSLDIDHIIPLGYADLHGGSEWDEDRKEEFANDHINLRAVSASENRSKGASGPAEWMVPENESYHCEYAQIWVETLDVYGLSTTSDDKEALSEALETC